MALPIELTKLINQIIEWIETHQHTVELLKWTLLTAVAWGLGVFRAIKDWARRPSISIQTAYSHCYHEFHSMLGNHSNVDLLVFVLDVEVLNPTGSPVAVRSFQVEIRKRDWLRRWTTPTKSIGFPSMPATPMPGGKKKVVPIWLTTFAEYGEKFCCSRVDGHDSQTALTFFAIGITSDSLPSLKKCCTIRLIANFACGKAQATASIKVRADLEHLGRMASDSVSFVRHPSVWTMRK